MQVCELIELLQTVNPNLYITVYDTAECARYDITNNDIDLNCEGIFEFNIDTTIHKE